MYSKIYDFCKVKNKGNCFKNGKEIPPRLDFLMKLAKSHSIHCELDVFQSEHSYDTRNRYKSKSFFLDEEDEVEPEENNFFNLILPGTSNKMVVAHHDVVVAELENANDNSASCINAIALKILVPSLNVILLDGEEYGGLGSTRAAQRIQKGDFGSIEWVLNLELTGRGGDLFFVGNYPGQLNNKIISLFDCPVFDTPFNDSVNFRKAGIDSTVINPLPRLDPTLKLPGFFEPVIMNGQELDTSILLNCHNSKDSIDKISPVDMKIFVEKILYKIVTS